MNLYKSSIVALAIALVILALLSGCELAVRLDLGLVDAGTAPCAICLDDADTVIYDDAGDPEIVAKDAAIDAADDAPDATDAGRD